MFVPSSVLAALTIAGAFWVGVLAARRLRQWGDSQRSIEGGDDGGPDSGDRRGTGHPRAAIAGARESQMSDGSRARHFAENARAPYGLRPVDGTRSSAADASARVREALARKIEAELQVGGLGGQRRRLVGRHGEDELGLGRLRIGDVVSYEPGDFAGRPDPGTRPSKDYLVQGILHLREGDTTTRVVIVDDSGRSRWLVGSDDDSPWYWLEPIVDHQLSGEPPRQITRPDGRTFRLERRAQHSAALTGSHGRPDLPRTSTYLYRHLDQSVLWIERWGDRIMAGVGIPVTRAEFSFYPGSS
jgi:hypothetical protein